LGIDRFMSEARAITNVMGNGVAAIMVAKWRGVVWSRSLVFSRVNMDVGGKKYDA